MCQADYVIVANNGIIEHQEPRLVTKVEYISSRAAISGRASFDVTASDACLIAKYYASSHLDGNISDALVAVAYSSICRISIYRQSLSLNDGATIFQRLYYQLVKPA